MLPYNLLMKFTFVSSNDFPPDIWAPDQVDLWDISAWQHDCWVGSSGPNILIKILDSSKTLMTNCKILEDY